MVKLGRPKAHGITLNPDQQQVHDKFMTFLQTLKDRGQITTEETIFRIERAIRRFLIETDVMKFYKGDGILDVDSGTPETEGFVHEANEWIRKDESKHKDNYTDELIKDIKYLLRSQKRIDVALKYKDDVFYRRIDKKIKAEPYVPSMPDVRKFIASINTEKHDALKKRKQCPNRVPSEIVKLYFQLCILTGARPLHVLQFTKNLFNTEERFIETFKKIKDKKRFDGAFYSIEMQPIVEAHLAKLPSPDSKLFGDISRDMMKYYFKAFSRDSGVKMTMKVARKVLATEFAVAGITDDKINVIESRSKGKDVLHDHYVKHDMRYIRMIRGYYDAGISHMPLLTESVPIIPIPNGEQGQDDKDKVIEELREQLKKRDEEDMKKDERMARLEDKLDAILKYQDKGKDGEKD